MKLRLLRFSAGVEDTIGLLFIDDEFACFTLEDQFQTEKVYGETRIPAGSYKIELRTEGGFHARYSRKFPDFHRGMLELQGVPNFKYILIHIGNRDDDTAGCILVGDSAQQNITEEGCVGYSTNAYRRVYPYVADALMAGETVTIDVEDGP